MSKIQDALTKIQSDLVRGDETASPVAASIPNQRRANDIGRLEAPHPTKEVLVVDMDRLMQAGILPHPDCEHLINRQFRDIKRPLIAHAFGKRATKVIDGPLIMITSALSGEGKSFTSINLALSMAQEKDHTVLLIDADVANPQISRIFGVADRSGLLDVLERQDMSLDAAIIPTSIDGLSVMPAGTPRAHATELLASGRMEQVAANLGTIRRNQIIIMDSPPLLQTSESKVLASFVGQIVMIVCADRTPQDAVLAAVALVDEGKPLNLVLNRASGNEMKVRYGYDERQEY